GQPPAALVPGRFPNSWLVLAGDDAPREPEMLVRKVQEYAQKATAMAKTAFSMVQESDAAQQARCPPALPPPPPPPPPSPGTWPCRPAAHGGARPVPRSEPPPLAGNGWRTTPTWRNSGWSG
uniref:Uncharacterized protein n=1 Tax=Aquila chrysaetos chrysaetos TaxID=223781 RepID=A0A663EDW1_AQUCH